MTKPVKELRILAAACLETQVQKTIERFNAEQSDVRAVAHIAGSVDCIRRVQKGEACDLLILADGTAIESMLMPEHTDGYYIFAGNCMVLVSNLPMKRVDTSNWKDRLMDPKATFGHADPSDDTAGYRAVMACMLADSVAPGLAKTLLNHPGRTVMTPSSAQVDFAITYRTVPISKKMSYAYLPDTMDLSNPAFNAHYASASIDIDGDGKNVICATAINHALTIPFTSKEPKIAQEFIALFLKTDFKAQGFLPRRNAVGNWAQHV